MFRLCQETPQRPFGIANSSNIAIEVPLSFKLQWQSGPISHKDSQLRNMPNDKVVSKIDWSCGFVKGWAYWLSATCYCWKWEFTSNSLLPFQNAYFVFLRCRGPSGSGRCECDAGYTGNGTHCTGQFHCGHTFDKLSVISNSLWEFTVHLKV